MKVRGQGLLRFDKMAPSSRRFGDLGQRLFVVSMLGLTLYGSVLLWKKITYVREYRRLKQLELEEAAAKTEVTEPSAGS